MIKLRKVKTTDWKLFLKWWQDEELISLTSGVREDSTLVLRGYFLKLLNSIFDQHYIILLEDKPIGHISLARKSKTTAEIHLIIGEKKYWGKGFGSVAIQKISKLAFEKFLYKKICLEVRPDNKRAISAYEKCGFVRGKLYHYPNTNQPVTLKMCLKRI
jgi:RimJ/RimL family protein N-acetyltransferase